MSANTDYTKAKPGLMTFAGYISAAGGPAAFKVSITGAKGDQGIQGVKGDQGIQGIQGTQGIQGPKGDPGNGSGDMLKSENLSGLANYSTARSNLGLGTLATQSGTFSGTSSGTNTGDQIISLTGDVTGSGGGSFSATIANGAVTLAKQANVATGSIFYRKTAGTGAPEVQSLATLKMDLGLTGTNSGDQTITLTGDVTGSGTGSFVTTLANSGVTAGTYTSVTVNAKGLVTAGSNPAASGGLREQSYLCYDSVSGGSFPGVFAAPTAINVTVSAMGSDGCTLQVRIINANGIAGAGTTVTKGTPVDFSLVAGTILRVQADSTGAGGTVTAHVKQKP